MTGRIDIHHHIFPPWLDKTKASENVGFKTPPENLPWTPEISLRAMARLGIDLAVLSYPAGMPGGPACAENRAAARRYNEYAARICADHPGRFAFFACTPNLFDSQGSIEEIRFAMDELNAVGVSLPSLYGSGLDASDDIFDTVWEELNRRSAVVFLHGAQIPSSTPCPHPLLGIPITEVPNETFKAAAHLVVTGKKRRFSNVRIVLAHLGGSTPFLAPRVAALSTHMGCPLTKDEILEDFKSFYFDTALSASDPTLAAMKTFTNEKHILYGTDFPVSVDTARWFTENLEAFYSPDGELLHQVVRESAKVLLRS